MAWTLCTSGSAIEKAGINVNSDVVDYGANRTNIDTVSENAEGFVTMQTGKDLSGSLTSFNVQIRNAISDAVSSAAAMDFISQDVSGYLSREADTLLNWNDDRMNKGIATIKQANKFTLSNPV